MQPQRQAVDMTLDGNTRIPLNKILAALRPDWTDAEINAATMTLAELPQSAGRLVIQAVEAALDRDHERAVTITWQDFAPVGVTLAQDEPCPAHGGTAKRRDGRWACCLVDDWWGSDDPIRAPRPVPVDLDAVRASIRGG